MRSYGRFRQILALANNRIANAICAIFQRRCLACAGADELYPPGDDDAGCLWRSGGLAFLAVIKNGPLPLRALDGRADPLRCHLSGITAFRQLHAMLMASGRAAPLQYAGIEQEWPQFLTRKVAIVWRSAYPARIRLLRVQFGKYRWVQAEHLAGGDDGRRIIVGTASRRIRLKTRMARWKLLAPCAAARDRSRPLPAIPPRTTPGLIYPFARLQADSRPLPGLPA